MLVLVGEIKQCPGLKEKWYKCLRISCIVQQISIQCLIFVSLTN